MQVRDALIHLACENHGAIAGAFTYGIFQQHWPAGQCQSWAEVEGAGYEPLPKWIGALVTMIETKTDLPWPFSPADTGLDVIRWLEETADRMVVG